MQGRAPTIDDVARAASVSTATVSRVLNGGRVAPPTRDRVAAAVARLGYRRNPHARGLATGTSGTVGVVVPDVAGPLYAQMARGVEDVTEPLGMQFFMLTDNRSAVRSDAAIHTLLERRVDALVLIGTLLGGEALHALVGDDLAVVLVEREADDAAPYPTIALDNEGGARAATRHLIERGHRHIAHVTGPRRAGAERLAGYRAALADAGLPEGPLLPSDFSEAAGLAAADALLRLPDVSAVFCANDRVALGLMHGLACAGARPGVDVSIVGFDDLPFGAFLTPPLTTVRQDARALGRLAAERAVALLRGADVTHDALVPTELVIRASVARGPAAAPGEQEVDSRQARA